MSQHYKIGVFDSGIGGLSVAQAVQHAMPEHEIIFMNDIEHVPYGNRSPEQIYQLIEPIFEVMVSEGCDVIVVACNTVTTTLIKKLRTRFDLPFVGMEPMVKPAASLTASKIIAVCATPATLKSKRYAWLKQTFAKELTVIEPDCSDWSFMIEHKNVDELKIRDRIESVCQAGADVIVLGCTHYHWIENLITDISAGRAKVLQPEQAVISQLSKVLSKLD